MATTSRAATRTITAPNWRSPPTPPSRSTRAGPLQRALRTDRWRDVGSLVRGVGSSAFAEATADRRSLGGGWLDPTTRRHVSHYRVELFSSAAAASLIKV